jgi:hypothetical protein
MKAKILTAMCIVTLTLAGSQSANAEEGPLAAAADVLVVRPACLAATVVGSAVFVIALPFALMSKSVRPTAEALVIQPAQATFTRRVGDLDALRDY